MTARFPRKTFRAEDAATGAWFEGDAVLCAVTGRLGYERVAAGMPPTSGAGDVVRRLEAEVGRNAVAWAGRKCGRAVRPWSGAAWTGIGNVA